MNADGSGAQQMTHSTGAEWKPEWSPLVTAWRLVTQAAGALLAIACAGLPLPAQRSGADTAIPFLYDDARVFVPVRMDSGPPLWFILDTGVSGVVLDAAVARAARLSTADAGRVSGVGKGSLAQARASGVTLHVGAVTLGPVDVGVVALDSVLAPYGGRAAPGIIGSPFFQQHVVELDFARSTMFLHDPTAYHYQGRGVVIPLRFVNDVPVADGRLLPPATEAISMRLLIDLGAKATLLVSEAFIGARSLTPLFPRRTESPLGAGIGGETRYAFARARSVALVDTAGTATAARLADPVVGLSVRGTLRSDWYDGLLGVEFIRAYRVIFDYGHHALILEPREPSVGAAEYDMSGMFIMSAAGDPHRFVIHEVLANGPAAAAGLATGDRIVSVDSLPAAQLSLGQLRNILRSHPGRPVDITIERDGQTVRHTVHLVRQV